MELGPGYKQTDVGVIPEDWEAVTVGEFAGGNDNIVDGPFGSNLKNSDYIPNGVPVLQGLNITNDRFAWKEVRYVSARKARDVFRSNARVGDLLTVKIGSVGFSALIDSLEGNAFAIIPANLMRVRFRNAKGDPRFAYYALTSSAGKQKLKDLAGNTAQPALGLGGFRKLTFPVPNDVEEQRAIAAALGDVDALIGALDRLIVKKRDLKQAAMQQLLTGQTRLPGFSRDWEVKRLGEVSPLQRGFDLPATQLRPGRYPVVYSNGVLNHHARSMVKGPGVVTGRSGTIGSVHFVGDDFWPHNTSLWVTSFRGNSPLFVFYLLTSLGLERFATGSGVPTLNRNDVHAHRVRIPLALAEQTAIAAVLSDMDAEIAALEARRDKTRALKQGMMQELLTGRIRLV